MPQHIVLRVAQRHVFDTAAYGPDSSVPMGRRLHLIASIARRALGDLGQRTQEPAVAIAYIRHILEIAEASFGE
jgi:hypothetical protein